MNIRNFSIIAHVDHGKSTLADRFLEVTGTIAKDKMKPQLLDSLVLERERGITIKLAPVRLKYKPSNVILGSTSTSLSTTPESNRHLFESEPQGLIPQSRRPEFISGSGNKILNQVQNDTEEDSGQARMTGGGEEYTLNLIDTPGHVDFSYEVSRSLAAVEGAILLVDATQGIQAQTLSHGLAALEQNLVLIPVINKIDLPNADIEKCKKELMDTFDFKENEILLASGKTGQGVEKILEAVIERVPPPKVEGVNVNHLEGGSGWHLPLRVLIFDSFFDSYKGVIAQVRVVDGEVPKVGSKIKFLGTGAEGQVLEVGIFTPSLQPVDHLGAGEIGYIATGVKTPDLVRVGDTIATSDVPSLPGYKEVKPMVYVGLYPIDQDEYHDIKDALEKFRLTDPAFTYNLEHSTALGAGFRCGFLGLLHAEVVQERLSGEFAADLIATAPSVEYMLGEELIHNPSDLPQGEGLKDLKEPWVSLKIFVPQNFIGAVMELVQDKRGQFLNMQHFGTQVELSYEMPLSEMITDFYDKLKSVSSGFASLDWEFIDFREVDAVRLDFLVGGEKVDALSSVVVRQKAENVGRKLAEKLKEVLPRQNFEVAIQAAIGGKIIARETVSSFRKDVTAKLYGGDRTRKDKLLEKQKKGKKKMKMIGRVEIPQEAFLSILKS